MVVIFEISRIKKGCSPQVTVMPTMFLFISVISAVRESRKQFLSCEEGFTPHMLDFFGFPKKKSHYRFIHPRSISASLQNRCDFTRMCNLGEWILLLPHYTSIIFGSPAASTHTCGLLSWLETWSIAMFPAKSASGFSTSIHSSSHSSPQFLVIKFHYNSLLTES